MKTWLFSLLALLLFLVPAAQDIKDLTNEAMRLESIPDEAAAFAKYKEVLKLNPSHVFALSKCSELCSRIGKRQTDHKLRDNYFEAARIYAGTALNIDSANSDANCSMAMALGHSTMSKSGKEKINNVKEIKKYVDRALKSNPDNFRAWHVLGRWHYEISNLNFFERAAVSVFYGGLPESSLKECIAAFEHSRALAQGLIINYFELARAYHRNDQDSKAITLLKTMLTLPIQTEDDSALKADGKKLLKLLQ